MTVAQPTEPVLLNTDQDGVIRVGGSRLTLETVVSFFDAGATPEEICDDFPGLELADAYAVVTYALRHRDEVDKYLAGRRQQAEAIRREVESSAANHSLRERLLARRRR
jgi:uncharacterized protein (DUF433 family)